MQPEDAFYVLGRSDAEYHRLTAQSELFNPFTERLLCDAGITCGMRVLDVGCGAGDVSLLIRALVGFEGEVIGVDRDSEGCEKAAQRAKALGYHNVEFLTGDLRHMKFEEPFDAAVGRFVLMYLADPVSAVRAVASHLRDGGVVVFQEMDFSHFPDSEPKMALWEQCGQWIRACFARAGTDMRMGLKLHHVFMEAGLFAPRIGCEVRVGGGPAFRGYGVVADTLRNILPMLQAFGIATAEQVGVDTLEQRLSVETTSARASVVTPYIVGAWARKR